MNLPALARVDIQVELKVLLEAIALLESPHRRKIDNAFAEALIEVNKPKPDKDKVGKALLQALDYAKRRQGENPIHKWRSLKPKL